jgi:hypothetical protein
MKTTSLLVLVLLTGACASPRLVSSTRVADVVLGDARCRDVARTVEAIGAVIPGIDVDRVGDRTVVVETPSARTADGAETWWVVRLDLAPAADGGCAVACTVDQFADGGDVAAAPPPATVEIVIRAATSR